MYPISLRLEGRRCVVVGGGKIAARKVPGLLNGGALITVISPHLEPILLDLSRQKKVDWRQSAYAVGMLAELRPLLVFAATDDPGVNRAVANEAWTIGALVDIVDDGEKG